MRKTVKNIIATVLVAATTFSMLSVGSASHAAEKTEVLDTSELSLKLGRPVGDLVEMTPISDVETISGEEASRIDRAMRAYTPPSAQLIVNKAKSFYYYSRLDDDQKQMYDAMYMVAMDPVAEDNYYLYLSSEDPSSDEFFQKMATSYFAMIYDHPELFWLYNNCQTSMNFATTDPVSDSLYPVYFGLSNPVENFEQEQKAFNDAAEQFLSDIDLKASEEEIAQEIHDKLTELVTYDMDVLNNMQTSGTNLAHTAYGALVENSDGKANYAVCDGYSLAYEYLLQQAGIEASFVAGVAGEDLSNTGGHAWSIVKLGDKWYEVDSTWDDQGSLEDQLTPDINGYEYIKEALDDPQYRDKIDHYLYRVTTKQITNYEPDMDYYGYITKDGKYRLSLVGSSVHIRDTIDTAGSIGAVMSMAPIAE